MRRIAAAVAALGACAAASTSCSAPGAEQGCPPPPACGGNIVGTWTFADNGCYALLPSAYKPIALYPQQTTPQTPSLSKPSGSSTTSGSWCSDLLYLPASPGMPRGQVMYVNLYANPAPLTGAQLTFRSDHTYSLGVTFGSVTDAGEPLAPAGLNTTHFTPECIQAFGANPTCADLAAAIFEFYIEPPPISNIQCTLASDQGCDCSYDYENPVVDNGQWATPPGGTLLYEYSDYAQQPYPVSYCVTGSGASAKLTLTGYQGHNLTNIGGLRTIVLQPGM
jgi:hypothetical protein